MGRGAALPVALALLAAIAPGAGAATLSVDRGCYLASQPGLPAGQSIGLRGDGFAPDAQVEVALGGVSVGALAANPAGAIAAAFQAPSLGPGQFGATRTLTASDGSVQASAPVRLRRLAADFLPSSGNPRTLRVRFYVYGFGPVLTATGRSTSQPVYQHVLDPAGRRRATFLVGRTRGPCGDLVTSRRRILPFRTVSNGRWRFVFNTRRAYSRRAAPAASIGLLVRPVLRRR